TKAGFPMRIWNRTPEKAAPLEALGAVRVNTPREAAEGGILITIIADDRALMEVATGKDGFLGALGPGGVHISSSTISPATARELARQHEEKGELYLAAPVSGRGDAAEAGALRICVS